MTPRQTPLDKRAHRQIFSRNETFDLSLHLKKSDSILDREDVRFDELWVTWPLWPVGGRGQKWYVVGRTCHAVGWQRSNVDSIVAVTSFISLERESGARKSMSHVSTRAATLWPCVRAVSDRRVFVDCLHATVLHAQSTPATESQRHSNASAYWRLRPTSAPLSPRQALALEPLSLLHTHIGAG